MRSARVAGWFFALVVLGAGCGGTKVGNIFDASADGTVDGGGGVHGDGGGIHFGGDSGAPKDTGACHGLACDVASCAGGSPTTVTGFVYAPNGTLPLYDVQVFIPNAPLVPFAKGVQCENCGAPLSGEPITTALSDPTGAFTLTGVPTGKNIPIVVQLGKWRRQATIPEVKACQTLALTDPNLTRLPKNQSEGSLPHVALTTGECDQMGCMLAKLGIDPNEFGSEADGYNKAINVYTGGTTEGAPDPSWTSATHLWGDPTTSAAGNIMTYDEAILSCECSESPGSKGTAGAAPFKFVTDYLNAGGRIFTTDFQYTWYKFSPDPLLGGGSTSQPDIGIGEIYGGAPPGTSPMLISKTVPKAVALGAWLKNIFSGVPLPSGVTFASDPSSQAGEITPDYVFGNIQDVDPKSTVTWASSAYESFGYGYGGPPGPPPDAGGIEPRIFTVDTPVGKKSSEQCGRGVHIDAHVDNDSQLVAMGFPSSGCGTPLKPDEAAFAFFFFDLSSCISNETEPPQPPPPAPK